MQGGMYAVACVHLSGEYIVLRCRNTSSCALTVWFFETSGVQFTGPADRRTFEIGAAMCIR